MNKIVCSEKKKTNLLKFLKVLGWIVMRHTFHTRKKAQDGSISSSTKINTLGGLKLK